MLTGLGRKNWRVGYILLDIGLDMLMRVYEELYGYSSTIAFGGNNPTPLFIFECTD